ncbi:hypothetical protein ACFWDG_25120 [Peribacillus sp. NPDC060186]
MNVHKQMQEGAVLFFITVENEIARIYAGTHENVEGWWPGVFTAKPLDETQIEDYESLFSENFE